MLPILLITILNSPLASDQQKTIEAETRDWHQKRIARLTAEDGWLTLVGLHWLKDGRNRFGSSKDNEVILPEKVPAHLGSFVLEGNAVRAEILSTADIRKGGQPFPGGRLASDAEGKPDVLSLGSLHFYVIQRGDKWGIRVKDSEAKARKEFTDIPMYPAAARWRLDARFEPAASPRTVSVPNVLGTVEPMPSPGAVVFTIDGKEYRLDPVLESGSKQLFFIFADETNRTETYGAGRFVYAEMPQNGRVTLDFNRAVNPPCAFSPYATCPLPPKQNRLPIRVEAGEKRYGHH